MNVALILDPFQEKSPGGLGRSIYEMAHALIAAHAGHDFTVYIKHALKEPPGFPGAHWRMRTFARPAWLFGSWGMSRSHDYYIFLTSIIPLFFAPKKSLVIAFDFAYLEIPSHTLCDFLSARILFYLQRRSFRIATRVGAISEQTAQEVIERFGISASKVFVVPLGYIPPSQKQDALPVPEKYFLFAGVLKERKNVRAIVEAFAQFARTDSETALLIAGKKTGSYAESLEQLARDSGVAERVHFLGYVSNEELSYLYARAHALIFPSLIEGFGMPVLEAMSVGLPVITSNRGALSEVAGEAALLVDPTSVGAIAEGMRRIAEDAPLRALLREKGFERAKQFTWEHAARVILQAL